jgi:hypothetical protein
MDTRVLMKEQEIFFSRCLMSICVTDLLSFFGSKATNVE